MAEFGGGGCCGVTHGEISYGRVWWREGCGEGVWGYTWCNQLWQSLVEGGVVGLHMVKSVMAEFGGGGCCGVTHGEISYGRVWWTGVLWGYTWWNQLWQSLVEGGVVGLHMVKSVMAEFDGGRGVERGCGVTHGVISYGRVWWKEGGGGGRGVTHGVMNEWNLIYST